MNKFLLGALAVAGVALSVPANAQSVYFGFGGGQGYQHNDWDNGQQNNWDNGYRSYDDGVRYYRPHRHYSAYDSDYRRCRVVRVWSDDYGYRRIRRCW